MKKDNRGFDWSNYFLLYAYKVNYMLPYRINTHIISSFICCMNNMLLLM